MAVMPWVRETSPAAPVQAPHVRLMCTTSTDSGWQRQGTLNIPGFQPKKSWKSTWHAHGFRGLLRKALSSAAFDYFISVVAILNSLVIGLEQSARLQGPDQWQRAFFEILETAFVAFYLIELVAVFCAYGLHALRSGWVWLDSFLGLVGLLSQLVIFHQHRFMQVGKSLQVLLLLRMVRILRLARTLRVMVRFRELWMLAQGFLNSLNMLFHTLVLGFALLYVYSCFAMELIPLSVQESGTELSEELQSNMEKHFRSLPVTMLTLIQFFNFDSSHVIYKPWIEEDPAMAIFFVAALLIMGVVFMNLVTATIVNSALENAMHDHEMQRAVTDSKRKALMEDLKDAFRAADINDSGELSRYELESVCKKNRALMHNIIGNNDIMTFFDYLDIDGNGAIGISEFCNGIESLVLSESPLEIKRMERMVESMRRQMKESRRVQDRLLKSLSRISAALTIVDEEEVDARAATPLVKGTDWFHEAPAVSTCSTLGSDHIWPTPAWANDILENLQELSKKVEESMGESALQRMASQAASAAVREAFEEDEEGQEFFMDSETHEDCRATCCPAPDHLWLEAKEEHRPEEARLGAAPGPVPGAKKPLLLMPLPLPAQSGPAPYPLRRL